MKTLINVLLDRSGSMATIARETENGFNHFIAEQRKVPGDCLVSLAQFDNEYQAVYQNRPIQEVPLLGVVPRNSTALLDAVCRAIDDTGQLLANRQPHDRPDKVIFVIITDGEENASTRHTLADVKQRITHQRETYGWEFVFLGANQDAFAVGQAMGVARGSTITYAANAAGTTAVYNSMSGAIGRSREGGVRGQSVFSDEDREAQKKAGVP